MAMNFETFCKEVEAEVKKVIGNSAEVELCKVTKNNEVELTGLSIRYTGENIAPNVYLNGYYEDYLDGKTIKAVAEDVLVQDRESRVHDFDAETIADFTNFEKIRNRIGFRLINTEANKKDLADVPHRNFMDLSVIYHVIFDMGKDRVSSAKITNAHMNTWGVTEEDLWGAALVNCRRDNPVTLKGLSDTLCEDFDAPGPVPQVPIDILTNKDKMFGATALLYPDIKELFAEKYGKNVWIIPSSVHEVLVYYDEADAEELKEMIQTVNENEVLPQEVLSDHPYKFLYETREFVVA